MYFLHLVAFIGTLGPAAGQLDLPDPRIVIVGPTGSGKSSLANALLGCDPRSNDCTFNVCPDLDSCTKETSIGTGPWLGTGQNFTVVDTPGFADSDGQDNKLIEEMMMVLDGSLGYCDTILLLFDGHTPRFTTGLQNMLRQMSSIFGEAWWDFIIVGVSKWKYSQEAIDERQENCDYYPDQCQDEAWFMRNINGQLQEKFHLERNFTFAFIDSYSQTAPQLGDEVQQEHYQAETKILWGSATTRNSTFDFMTIDDVLEENDSLKKEVKRLNDIIETNITTLFTLVHKTEKRIEIHETNITTNKGKTILNEISIGNVVNDVEKMRTDITTNKGKTILNENSIGNITKRVNDVVNDVEKMRTRVNDVVNDVEKMRTAPIGTILAWINKPSNTSTDGEVVDIPAGWVRCNGDTIPHQSIWAGQKTPNLNGEKRFLRGGDDKDIFSMEEDQLLDHNHTFIDPGHTHVYIDKYPSWTGSDEGFDGPHQTDTIHDRFDKPHTQTSSSGKTGVTVGKVNPSYNHGTETRPKNMNVVFIIRIY